MVTATRTTRKPEKKQTRTMRNKNKNNTQCIQRLINARTTQTNSTSSPGSWSWKWDQKSYGLTSGHWSDIWRKWWMIKIVASPTYARSLFFDVSPGPNVKATYCLRKIWISSVMRCINIHPNWFPLISGKTSKRKAFTLGFCSTISL